MSQVVKFVARPHPLAIALGASSIDNFARGVRVIHPEINELTLPGGVPLPTRVRIAFVIDVIGAWNLGGTEKQLALLVSQLDRRLFEPVIFVLQASAAAQDGDVGCPVVIVNPGRRQSRWQALVNLRSVLKRFDPHIVQTFFIDGTFYGTVAAWLNRVPVVVQSRRNAGHWQKAHHTLALRAINHLVDSWQCNSRFVAESLRQSEGVARERISVLPNSIDLAHFAPVTAEMRREARRRLDLPLEAPIFVSVATLRPVKGLTTVVESAAELQTRLPGALFLIVGEGPQREQLDQLIERKGLTKSVRLVGSQTDVQPWLAAADLGILASQSESSSNALLEYMAMGLPAVVSDIPANRELVDGEFFAVGDGAQLAARLAHLWAEPGIRSAMAARYRDGAMPFGEAAIYHRAQKYYLGLASKALKTQKRGAHFAA